MEFVRNDQPRKSSGFVGSFVGALIVTLIAVIFSMFGYYGTQLWANFWPSFSNWMSDVFLSDSETAYYKFGGVWFGSFILFLGLSRLTRR